MLAVIAALLACLLEWWDQTRGAQPWPLPATTALALLSAAAAVLVLALPVRRWTRGDRSRHLDPLRVTWPSNRAGPGSSWRWPAR
jgi:hypothetical protein